MHTIRLPGYVPEVIGILVNPDDSWKRVTLYNIPFHLLLLLLLFSFYVFIPTESDKDTYGFMCISDMLW